MELQQNIDNKLQLPQIVPFLANTVRETNGQMSEGIFRVPGDADAVTDLVSSLAFTAILSTHLARV
jgi:hypothetical protein